MLIPKHGREPDIKGGRPSIAPEKFLRAMLLQMFYSIRERLFAFGELPS